MSDSNLITKVAGDIKTVCCTGGDKAMGHPAVYYNFGEKKKIECQYCGNIFLKPH